MNFRRFLYGSFLAAAAFSISAASRAGQTSYYLYDVVTNGPAEVQRLCDSSVILMGEDAVIGVNPVAVRKGDELSLAMLGLKARFTGVYEPNTGQSLGDGIDYRTEWLTYVQIMDEWDALQTAYPWLIRKRQIGVTRENRPIYAFRFFKPVAHDVFNPPKSMLFIGDTHAREWISPSALLHIGKMLAQELGTSDTMLTDKLVDKVGVWFVPVFNVDGYIYSWTNERMWRKNRRNNGTSFGVDLNRNYEKGWGGAGSSGTPSSDVYRGPSAASEPELQAIKNLALSLPNLTAVIDVHSFGAKILYPWSYTTSSAPAGAVALFSAIGNAAKDAIFNSSGTTYIVGQGAVALYVASGSSKDWFYDRFGCPSYTIEIAGTVFDPPTSSIAPTQDHVWHGFRAFVMAAAP